FATPNTRKVCEDHVTVSGEEAGRTFDTGSGRRLGMRLLIGLVLALVLVALAPTGSPPAVAVAKRPLRIGYVPDTDLSDSPINRTAVAGLRRAVRELGVTAEVRTPNPREGLDAAFEAFAKQGYDLVIGFGPGEAPVLARVAQQYPRTRFAIIDVSRSEFVAHGFVLPNLTGIVFREQEVAYLV